MTNRKNNHKNSAVEEFEILPWDDKFDTGIEHIDKQHRTLVKLLNKLARSLIEQNYSTLNSTFDELANYATLHFMDEESVWLEYFDEDDQWFRSHHYNHNSFMPKVHELQVSNAGKSLPEIVEKIMHFLVRWLAFHIIEDDKRMALAIDVIKLGVPVEDAKMIAENKMTGSLHVLLETILNMYDDLTSRAFVLMRERNACIKAEHQLKEANRKLSELSNTDQLTGLYNRRYLDIVFESEIRRALRDRSLLTYYMIDVDYFKHYNDNYGHPAGDVVLRQIADSLKDICRRAHDFVFRVGGEEFGILTTFRKEQKANVFAETIRKSIEDLKIPHEYSDVSIYVTISVGGLCCLPSQKCDFRQYMDMADKRLYIAKTNGRNRVVMEE